MLPIRLLTLDITIRGKLANATSQKLDITAVAPPTLFTPLFFQVNDRLAMHSLNEVSHQDVVQLEIGEKVEHLEAADDVLFNVALLGKGLEQLQLGITSASHVLAKKESSLGTQQIFISIRILSSELEQRTDVVAELVGQMQVHIVNDLILDLDPSIGSTIRVWF